jgi:hypothetical protein
MVIEHVDQDSPTERACVRGSLRGYNPMIITLFIILDRMKVWYKNEINKNDMITYSCAHAVACLPVPRA